MARLPSVVTLDDSCPSLVRQKHYICFEQSLDANPWTLKIHPRRRRRSSRLRSSTCNTSGTHPSHSAKRSSGTEAVLRGQAASLVHNGSSQGPFWHIWALRPFVCFCLAFPPPSRQEEKHSARWLTGGELQCRLVRVHYYGKYSACARWAFRIPAPRLCAS